MERKFGIEMEFQGERSVVYTALQQAGINVAIESYNHTTRGHWKIVTDASVGTNGGELVSPILFGDNGLEQIKKVCSALSNTNVGVNKLCGLHVHIDASNLTIDTIKHIVKRYAKYEEHIDAFMPRSRRKDTNRFCKSTKTFLENYNLGNLTFNNLGNLDRFFKVNLKSYIAHGTIEFRQHSGTLNSQKIINWVKFLQNFVSKSIITYIEPTIQTNSRFITLTNEVMRTKTHAKRVKVINALKNNEHISFETIAFLTGWANNTIAANLSNLRKYGFKFNILGTRVTLMNKNHDFIMENTNIITERQEIIEDDHNDCFYGLANEIRNYFVERVMELR